MKVLVDTALYWLQWRRHIWKLPSADEANLKAVYVHSLRKRKLAERGS